MHTVRTVVSCLERSVALEGPRSGGEGSCASSGGAARAANGIRHSLPRYSVSALILAGTRVRRQGLPGIPCSVPQGHAGGSGSALPTRAPANPPEAPRLLGLPHADTFYAAMPTRASAVRRQTLTECGCTARRLPAAAPSSRSACGSSPRGDASRGRW